MKVCVLFILLLSFSSHAGMVKLPDGGSFFVETNEWNVQQTPFVAPKKSLMFMHKTHKELIGHLMDGNIRGEAYCGKNQKKSWIVCEKDFPAAEGISKQFVLQKYIGANNYQNYVIVFNHKPAKNPQFASVLTKFKKNMEKNK